MNAAPAWVERARQLDAVLFKPAGLLPLAADNTRVPRVVLPSLERAQEIVDAGGRVATYAGELRQSFVVVDVDIDDAAAGRQVVEELSMWLRGRERWHVIRPSGGAPGRHHIFVHVEDQDEDQDEDQLRGRVEALRGRLRLPHKRLEVRRHVRPLSAPHRTGRYPKPISSLTLALRGLPPLAASPDSTNNHDPNRHPRKRLAGRPGPARQASPLVPSPRPRRALPQAWARYLATGEEPPLGGSDHSASTYGARVTAELVRAGYDVDQAWDLIANAHPAAMTHTRAPGRGRGWWITYQWNPAVEHDQTWRAQHAPTRLAAVADDEVTAVVEAAREALRRFQWHWGPRARHSIVLVAHALLDRALREKQLTVPCPQRNLCLDTGLTRPTVARALEALDGLLGVLARSFDPTSQNGRERSSHEFTLTRISLHTHIDGQGGGTSFTTCSSHPPPPPGTWHRLPPAAHSVWRALDPTTGQQLEDIAQRAGLTPGPSTPATTEQLRTVRNHLTALSNVALASCDADGRWSITDPAEAWSSDHVQRSQRARAPMADQVACERQEYRTAPSCAWRRARDQAIEHERRKAAARYAAWRARLTPDAHRARSTAHAAAYARLSIVDQARLKHLLAQRRRARLGPSEADRHDTWCRSMTATEYADRAAERQRLYETLPAAQRSQAAAAWQAHRDSWHVPQGHPDERQRASRRPAGRALPHTPPMPAATLTEPEQPELVPA